MMMVLLIIIFIRSIVLIIIVVSIVVWVMYKFKMFLVKVKGRVNIIIRGLRRELYCIVIIIKMRNVVKFFKIIREDCNCLLFVVVVLGSWDILGGNFMVDKIWLIFVRVLFKLVFFINVLVIKNIGCWLMCWIFFGVWFWLMVVIFFKWIGRLLLIKRGICVKFLGLESKLLFNFICIFIRWFFCCNWVGIVLFKVVWIVCLMVWVVKFNFVVFC